MNGDKLYDANGTLRYVAAPAQEAEPSKRLAINMSPDLHTRFKVACARCELVMADEVLAFIERRTVELEHLPRG
jgi:hypothetical protein